MRRSRLPSILIGAGCVLCAADAGAETGSSSWVKRTIPQTPAQAQPVTGTPRRPVPGLRTTTLPTSKPGKRRSLGKTMVVPSGEDAAYIAFDQGQYLTALRLAEERAKKRDPQAHTLIGRIHAEGLGVPKNELTAAKWYHRGAELGDIEAMFAFGVILISGRSVKKDPNGAARMFERAARKGHAYAHYNLALLFLSGQGKPENPYRAAQHLEYAARKGIAEAQYDLAALYQKGHGVDADAYQAALWLREAADKGLAAAEFEYGIAILRGRAFNQDGPKVIDYLTSAAGKGVAGAQNRLANIYAVGAKGISANRLEAAKWRLIAKRNGIKDDALDTALRKYPKNILDKAESAAQDFENRAGLGFDANR
ncbi:MAG: tetratricopeptide repeat protein [Hyphomicrobiaceae bacterium]